MLEIKKDTLYHCSTFEVARMLMVLANNKGYKWINGESIGLSSNKWSFYKENTVYNITRGTIGSLKQYKNTSLSIVTVTEDMFDCTLSDEQYKLIETWLSTISFYNDIEEKYLKLIGNIYTTNKYNIIHTITLNCMRLAWIEHIKYNKV